MRIVGREREQAELRRLLASSESEFLVVYGRRRVGKTFLPWKPSPLVIR